MVIYAPARPHCSPALLIRDLSIPFVFLPLFQSSLLAHILDQTAIYFFFTHQTTPPPDTAPNTTLFPLEHISSLAKYTVSIGLPLYSTVLCPETGVPGRNSCQARFQAIAALRLPAALLFKEKRDRQQHLQLQQQPLTGAVLFPNFFLFSTSFRPLSSGRTSFFSPSLLTFNHINASFVAAGRDRGHCRYHPHNG
jgi:hypothetical protein